MPQFRLTPFVDASKDLTVKRRSLKTRWLAASTGLIMVPGCLGITVYSLVLPTMLIVGAIVADVWPRVGRWLMWIGASSLTVLVFPWCVAILLHPGGPVDLMISASLASAILLPPCDVALIVDVFKGRNAKRSLNPTGL